MTNVATESLSRRLPGAPPAPSARIVHLGVGNFSRSHQAWYTWHAPDAADWGIVGFTGRRPDAAQALAPQDGLYTLITRAAEGDLFELIGSLALVHPASDHEIYLGHLAAGQTAVVTITVTEAGYLLGPDGHLRNSDQVIADRDALRADPRTPVHTLPAKLLAGLLARRAAAADPVTIMSCDNLPHNGGVARTVVTELAEHVDPTMSDWIASHVDFASSMVDRITPATTDADRRLVAEHEHYRDAAPVATEPFSEWVIAGRFPAGRPTWEESGARIVDDVAPYEQRKLTLLNGSHSLLAYAGSIRGHSSIDEAIADETCRGWVEQFWDEAQPHLVLRGAQVTDYRDALLQRFANPRIRHQLSQIAPDGSTKIPVRILPTVRAERAGGRVPTGCATALAAWVLHLRGHGAPINDAGAEPFVAAAAASELRDAVRGVLDRFDPDLGSDQAMLDAVVGQTQALGLR
jgi:fructuronate reductase